MEDWVYRALEKWPNVPHLYGWLRLDRRGRWRIQGEIISRPQIIDTFNANYAADERGCWYFQNGPQRGYMALDDAPLILRVDGVDTLHTHTGLRVQQVSTVFLDEDGGLMLATEHGAGRLEDDALPWALTHITQDGAPVDDAALAVALTLASGTPTALRWDDAQPILRLDTADAPATLGFVREPQP